MVTARHKSDYRGMAKWFGAHYDQEVRFRSAVKCKKGPQVLTSLLNHRRNINNYYYLIILSLFLTYFLPFSRFSHFCLVFYVESDFFVANLNYTYRVLHSVELLILYILSYAERLNPTYFSLLFTP